ncbi:MAG: YitT family protein [Candidatus Cloacimonetes bacterium]|nr:YitT family protein [Candidatus Cloacimonadota bacterium]MDY0366735.1 YitT family protein [Candidatus Syntrophosphaera sp.]
MKKLQGKQLFLREAKYMAGIVFGALLVAIGYAWFLMPYNMAPGGVGGLAQVLNFYFRIPVGMSMIILNIPLFVISFIFIGRSFGAKSVLGMLISSVFTDLVNIQNIARIGILSLGEHTYSYQGRTIFAYLGPEDLLLSAIAGSVVLGLGLGIIFKSRGSTGGTDIPVALIKQKAGVSIGTGYYIVESGIILLVAILLKDPKILIWGYINLFITTKITDLASEGLPYIKGVYVISPKVDEIKEDIYTELDRGVTFFKALGGYEKKETEVLFCVINRRQVPLLTDIVKDIDPDAFMIVTDVYDVLGYGFRSRKINLSE